MYDARVQVKHHSMKYMEVVNFFEQSNICIHFSNLKYSKGSMLFIIITES